MLIKVSRSGTFRPFHDQRYKTFAKSRLRNDWDMFTFMFQNKNNKYQYFFKWVLLVDKGGEDE